MKNKKQEVSASKTFVEWFKETKPADTSDTVYIHELAQKSGVSRETIRTILTGRKLTNYKKAMSLETLTGLPASVFLVST